jgi:hypothetical protein
MMVMSSLALPSSFALTELLHSLPSQNQLELFIVSYTDRIDAINTKHSHGLFNDIAARTTTATNHQNDDWDGAHHDGIAARRESLPHRRTKNAGHRTSVRGTIARIAGPHHHHHHQEDWNAAAHVLVVRRIRDDRCGGGRLV